MCTSPMNYNVFVLFIKKKYQIFVPKVLVSCYSELYGIIQIYSHHNLICCFIMWTLTSSEASFIPSFIYVNLSVVRLQQEHHQNDRVRRLDWRLDFVVKQKLKYLTGNATYLILTYFHTLILKHTVQKNGSEGRVTIQLEESKDCSRNKENHRDGHPEMLKRVKSQSVFYSHLKGDILF